MSDPLVPQSVDLPGGEISILLPRDGAALPDKGGVDWAPLVPYWSVLWRSGVALARELEEEGLGGRSVLELGCGLGLPSLAAARSGATVLATDRDAEAVDLVERNARENDLRVEALPADWSEPGALLARAPFDLVLGADVLYERASVAQLLDLLPRLAPEAIVADPGRSIAEAFLDQARRRWRVEARVRGVVSIYRIGLK